MTLKHNLSIQTANISELRELISTLLPEIYPSDKREKLWELIFKVQQENTDLIEELEQRKQESSLPFPIIEINEVLGK